MTSPSAVMQIPAQRYTYCREDAREVDIKKHENVNAEQQVCSFEFVSSPAMNPMDAQRYYR